MKQVTITFPMPENNEATASPYWLILDPHQMMRPDVDRLANMITGPFFSREDAQAHLEARRHHFSSRACVYCHTGYASQVYATAWRKARQEEE